jgi:hypothetical protein
MSFSDGGSIRPIDVSSIPTTFSVVIDTTVVYVSFPPAALMAATFAWSTIVYAKLILAHLQLDIGGESKSRLDQAEEQYKRANAA